MDRLEYGNLRALADKRRHHLSRKNDQANRDASLKEMPHRLAHLPATERKRGSERHDCDNRDGVRHRPGQ